MKQNHETKKRSRPIRVIKKAERERHAMAAAGGISVKIKTAREVLLDKRGQLIREVRAIDRVLNIRTRGLGLPREK